MSPPGSRLAARAERALAAEPPRSDDTAPAILTAIGGAVARQRLHALHPARPGQEAAATGFALALLLSLDQARLDQTLADEAPVLWVQERQATVEAGRPYGPGLAALGLDPRRLVVVSVRGAMNALAAAEMGLEEAGFAGVLVDLPQRLPSDMLRLGKRLSLRAETRKTPCFLLHAGGDAVEAPVATRWQVASGALPALPKSARRYVPPDFITAFDVSLTKNRFGPLGLFRIAWRPLEPRVDQTVASVASTRGSHEPRFMFVDRPPPLSEPVAAALADRSAASSAEARGAVVAWPHGRQSVAA